MEECTNRDLQERTLSMGMIFGLGALIMFSSFVWQVCMFTMLLSGIRKRSWMSVVIGGIIYTISVGVSLLCYGLANSAADYGGFSKDFTIFSVVVLVGCYIAAFGIYLQKRFVILAGILSAIAPFFYLFILLLA